MSEKKKEWQRRRQSHRKKDIYLRGETHDIAKTYTKETRAERGMSCTLMLSDKYGQRNETTERSGANNRKAEERTRTMPTEKKRKK